MLYPRGEEKRYIEVESSNVSWCANEMGKKWNTKQQIYGKYQVKRFLHAATTFQYPYRVAGPPKEGTGMLFCRSMKLSLLLKELYCLYYNIASNNLYTFYYYSLWGETESTWYCGHYWPIVPAPDDRWWWLWSNRWNEDWQGKPKYSKKTCPSATLFATNPTWPDSGSNPGRRRWEASD
jgi:hypothetical protein